MKSLVVDAVALFSFHLCSSQVIGEQLAVLHALVPARQLFKERGVSEHHENLILSAHQPVPEPIDAFLKLVRRLVRLKRLSRSASFGRCT